MKRRDFLGSAVVAGGAMTLARGAQIETSDQPNIIFILIDDLGKEWLSCYGAEGIDTPNIDRTAREGIRFTNAFSMPQCTPSRACFMTGQYPFRNGWVNHWDVPRWGIGYFDWKKNPSIARVMRSAGYKTAAAGKWQINDFRLTPEAMGHHGFDDYCMWTGAETGVKASGQRYWNPYIHTKSGSKTYEGRFGEDVFLEFFTDFMRKNKEHPIFLYYPMCLTHGPLTTTPLEPKAGEGLTGEKKKFAMHRAMVRYTDHILKQLIETLEAFDLRKKTIIVWTTDNGTSGSLHNLREGRDVKGGKAKTTENGVNAPFIVNCPGLVPQGRVSDALVDFTDMLPTFAALGGARVPTDVVFDGVSLKDLFLGKSKDSPREWIMAMGGGAGVASSEGVENRFYWRDRVVREKRYKLFVGPDREVEKLVDVINDPDEQTDLSANPELAGVLRKLKKAADAFPLQDNDPIYIPMPANKWDRKPSVTPQVHKQGHPDHEEKKTPREPKRAKKRTK